MTDIGFQIRMFLSLGMVVPVESRDWAPVEGLRDEVCQKLRHSC